MTKNIFSRAKAAVIALIAFVLISAGGLHAYRNHAAESELDSVALGALLRDFSELTTQRLVVTDVFEATKGSIPIINKQRFLVKYRATVSAGFDVSEANAEVQDGKVLVEIPHCTIDEESVNVRGSDMRLYDTNLAIFNPPAEAVIELLSEAEKQALEFAKAEDSGLLDAADENAVNIVKGLFASVAEGREIVVSFK